MRTRADQIKSQLDEVAGDFRATWRRAQSLLHNNRLYRRRVCHSRVDVLPIFRCRQVGPNPRQHSYGAAVDGATCLSWQTTFRTVTIIIIPPVSTEEMRRLLSTIPSKSSPLYDLLCSLLKSCTNVQASPDSSVCPCITGSFSRYKQAQVLALSKKAGLNSSLSGNYRPISNY